VIFTVPNESPKCDLQYIYSTLWLIINSFSTRRYKEARLKKCNTTRWATQLLVGQPKVKIFLLFLEFMKRPQTKFHGHIMRESQVIRSNKVKIYH